MFSFLFAVYVCTAICLLLTLLSTTLGHDEPLSENTKTMAYVFVFWPVMIPVLIFSAWSARSKK